MQNTAARPCGFEAAELFLQGFALIPVRSILNMYYLNLYIVNIIIKALLTYFGRAEGYKSLRDRRKHKPHSFTCETSEPKESEETIRYSFGKRTKRSARSQTLPQARSNLKRTITGSSLVWPEIVSAQSSKGLM